jgi:hypothetical protein
VRNIRSRKVTSLVDKKHSKYSCNGYSIQVNDVKHSKHTSFAVRMAKLRLHASFKFHTALYHVEIVRARVYVLDSRF